MPWVKDSKVCSISLPIAVWGQPEHQSAGGEQLFCASLVLLGFYSSLISIFIIIIIIIAAVVIIISAVIIVCWFVSIIDCS